MKKLGIIFSLVFVFLLTTSVNVFSLVFAAGENSIVMQGITSATQFSEIKADGNYILESNIDFGSIKFVPIENFNGVFDGNGYKISNITFTDVVDKNPDGHQTDPPVIEKTISEFALFLNTKGAKIKNLCIENINVSINQNAETESLKVATLVANADQGTVIENCSVRGDKNEFNIVSKSRSYIGGIVAKASNGTVIKNSFIENKILFKNTSITKNNYVGGIVGYMDNSQASYVIADSNLTIQNLSNKDSYVGGAFGFISGEANSNVSNIVLNQIFSDIDTAENMNIGTVIGGISTQVSSVPKNASIQKIYTNLDGQTFGNANDITSKFEVLNFDVQKIGEISRVEVVTKDTMTSKSFYIDKKDDWDFTKTWQIEEEKITLPSLQVFSNFTYSVSIEQSFNASQIVIPKTPVKGEIINIDTNMGCEYKYGEPIRIGGYITDEHYYNKLFKIEGIRQENKVIFNNNTVLNIINNTETVKEDVKEGVISYKLDGVEVVETATRLDDRYNAFRYELKGSNVIWYTYSTTNSEDMNANMYIIENCNLSNTGEYTFVLNQIEHQINVLSDNVSHGTVKREDGIKQESLVALVKYGAPCIYRAESATSDFAFNKWYNSREKETEIESLSRIEFIFNETLFEDGGIFEGKSPEDELVLVATFTKRVCDLTIKFAIDNVIVDDILSTIKIDSKPVEKDGVMFIKLAMNKSYYIEVETPAGYSFVNWFTSDGITNLGNIGETTAIDFEVTNENESLVLVANVKAVEVEENNNSALIWIISGSAGGLLLIGIVVFIIIKKKSGGGGYKNMY